MVTARLWMVSRRPTSLPRYGRASSWATTAAATTTTTCSFSTTMSTDCFSCSRSSTRLRQPLLTRPLFQPLAVRWQASSSSSSSCFSSESHRWRRDILSNGWSRSWSSWLLLLLLSSNRPRPTPPKGFESFFPPKHSKRDVPDSSSSSSKHGGDTTTTTTTIDKEESSRLSSSDKDGGSNNNKGGGGSPKPPPNNKNHKKNSDDDNNNNWNELPGLLALLALVVAWRSWLEQDESNNNNNGLGTEITFVDFRNHFLGHVEKVQVINRQVARVVLRPDAMLDQAPPSLRPSTAADRGGNNATAAAGFDDDTQMAFEQVQQHGGEMGSSASPSSTPTRRGARRQPGYYFHIGSVESFEEKLAKAQTHLHPEEWVEVQYVTRTNWGLEALKIVPTAAFVAAVYFGSRGLIGMGGGMAGGRGGSGGGGGGMGGIFSIGRSTAKKIKKEDIHVTFNDVAGCQQAKMEIMEFVDFLKDSERFTKLGAKIPKGALLCGPPGTGKTLLAKAVAGEAGVPFYSISGSDFIEMFVGVGPSRVRDLFKEARANAPCIIFIDEIDAVGRQRGRGGFSGGGNDERENTLNQLLVEMDGFSPTTGIVVIAGTNRVDILDQALTRPGRFDRQITVDRPDLQGRKEIFEVHLKNITLKGPIEEYAGRLAGLTPGFAGAEIANICNEAAIVAARRKADSVSLEDFEKASDRIIGGLESNKIISAEERSIVAHHEAGHAIAGWFLEHADPLLKVTIIPRTSGALGFAQYLPKEVFLRSEEQLMDLVCMALAGRAAEEVFFGRVTTGASDDLRRVTQLVYGMIKNYGMNNRLGQLVFPSRDNDMPGDKPYSESTAETMDEEARALAAGAYQRTIDLIREHREEVEKVAKMLLDKETITHDDIFDLVGPRPFVPDSAYQEYVTSRIEDRKKDAEKAENKDANEESNAIGGGEGLTPGLA